MPPDHREPVRVLLARYVEANPDESAVARRILALVDAHADCLLRTCRVGHVTASALILSPDLARGLLTHHKKLDRWLQLGGHVDGDSDVARSALREAREESGMERFSFFPPSTDPPLAPLPIDLDVHEIPARGNEPRHEHHDIRFLLVAEDGQTIRVSDESHDLRWFALADIAAGTAVPVDESVARLARKALARAARIHTTPWRPSRNQSGSGGLAAS